MHRVYKVLLRLGWRYLFHWRVPNCVPQAVRSLGGLPGVVKADLDPLLRRLNTSGDGRVSLPAFMEWARRDCLSTAGVENEVKR